MFLFRSFSRFPFFGFFRLLLFALKAFPPSLVFFGTQRTQHFYEFSIFGEGIDIGQGAGDLFWFKVFCILHEANFRNGLSSSKINDIFAKTAQQGSLRVTQFHVPAKAQRPVNVNEGVKDFRSALFFPLVDGDVVAGVGACCRRKFEKGRRLGEFVDELGKVCFVGKFIAQFQVPNGDESAQESPRAGRPLDYAFVNVMSPRRGVETPRSKVDFEV